MAELSVNTVVQVPFGVDHEGLFLAGDDDVPEWAARQMGTHCFKGGEHPYPDDSGDDTGKHAQETERPEGTPPPKAGAGSGRDNWLAYADEIDVEIPKGTQRDAIIQMIADAGKPVDPPVAQ